MPKRLLPLIAGEYYHIFNRGVNKRSLFKSRIDYARILDLTYFYSFSNTPFKFSWFTKLSNRQQQKVWQNLSTHPKLVDIITFCYMPNHYHFIVHQLTETGISKFISHLQNSYARYFNTKYDRIGPLWQGPFKGIRITNEHQLLHLSRYIHLNPYSSSVVNNFQNLQSYPWSSLPEYLGKTGRPLSNPQIVISSFKNTRSYLDFVLDNADYQKQLELIKHLFVD